MERLDLAAWLASLALAGSPPAHGSEAARPPASPPPTLLRVEASEACEPPRPECSIAAALALLAPGGTLALSPGRHRANLRLARDVTLEGTGAGRTILDGGRAGRVVKVETGVRATLRGLTVAGGRLERELEVDGGGIWNLGTLALERCEVTDNVAIDDGGGIRNDGSLTLLESSVHGNQATRWGSAGGGIYNPVILGTPELAIVASTISGNVAGDNGGGIWCESTVTIVNSTVSGNRAAHTGGGIRNNGSLSIDNSTIAFNRAGTTGGGLRNFGTATLANTVLAANSAAEEGPDCGGPLASAGHNLIGDVGGCYLPARGAGDLLGADPKLAPLADNGGATLTHAPAAGSPALDAGSPAPAGGTGACAGTDQRGEARPGDGDGDGMPRCDVGAVEAGAGS